MNQTLRYIIGGVGSVFLVLALVFGSYLPYTKASRYIEATRQLSSIHSIKDFQDTFDQVMTLPSPVGGEESAKFLSSLILNVISQGGLTSDAAHALVNYITPYMQPYNLIHLLTLGEIHEQLYKTYKNDADYLQSEVYYKAGLAIGPKVAPLLIELLRLYREKGDAQKLKDITNTIVSYWPDFFQTPKATPAQ